MQHGQSMWSSGHRALPDETAQPAVSTVIGGQRVDDDHSVPWSFCRKHWRNVVCVLAQYLRRWPGIV